MSGFLKKPCTVTSYAVCTVSGLVAVDTKMNGMDFFRKYSLSLRRFRSSIPFVFGKLMSQKITKGFNGVSMRNCIADSPSEKKYSSLVTCSSLMATLIKCWSSWSSSIHTMGPVIDKRKGAIVSLM